MTGTESEWFLHIQRKNYHSMDFYSDLQEKEKEAENGMQK